MKQISIQKVFLRFFHLVKISMMSHHVVSETLNLQRKKLSYRKDLDRGCVRRYSKFEQILTWINVKSPGYWNNVSRLTFSFKLWRQKSKFQVKSMILKCLIFKTTFGQLSTNNQFVWPGKYQEFPKHSLTVIDDGLSK